MARLQEILFSQTFDPEKDTGTLNSILEELYRNMASAQPAQPHRAAVTRTTSQSIANGGNTEIISFDSASENTNNFWTVGDPTKLYFRESGFYLVTASVQFATSTGGARRLLVIRKNGTGEVAREGWPVSTTSSAVDITLTRRLRFAVNDYIELRVFQNSGAALNVNSVADTSPYLEAIKIASD